jgi:hypothetical protein
MSMTLDQDVEHGTVLIHRPPQVVPFTVNREKYLVQVPFVTRSRAPAPELIGI